MTTEKQWLDAGGYLPPFLRDFHVQKDVFKWIFGRVEAAKANGRVRELGGMTWIGAHIFVIDFFLWYMARHGYTLQRTRHARWQVADWAATIDESKEKEREALRAMMAADKSANTADTARVADGEGER